MPVYDFIKISGCPSTPPEEAPVYFEIFVGIGGGVSLSTGKVNVTVEGGEGDDDDVVLPPPTRTEISQSKAVAEELWAAQDNLLKRQSAYIGEIKKELATKWEDLPSKLKERSVKEAAVEEFVKWLAGVAATYFIGPVAGELAKAGVTLLAVAMRLLKALYTEGEALCDALVKENDALLTFERSLENYQIRSTFITQHDHTLHNLMMKIADAERVIYSETSPSGDTGMSNNPHASEIRDVLVSMDDTLKLIQAEDNIVQCPHTGDCLYTKSLVSDDAELDP